MRTCDSCGFQNAEEGKPCPLCGASETQKASSLEEMPTIELAHEGDQARPRAKRDLGSLTAIGQVYASRYRVDGILGRGGMGQVFRIHDMVNHIDLALKILQPSPDDNSDRAERFKREIGILSRINHPTVPRIFDWGIFEGDLFFVSELVDGHDLRSEIRRRGAWNAAEASELAATVADALAAAHSSGVVHRDVKPSNIMIATDGSIRLLDFGLARATGIDAKTLTQTGIIVGTPGYMSPEQFDTHWVDERSDLYSLGVVLFELLTARLPFVANTPLAVAMMHKAQPPPSPRSLRHEVPAWIDRIVLKCLEKNPEKRFPSAASLATELRKPRVGTKPQMRLLPSGDSVMEDNSESSDWALVLKSTSEKTGWSAGMAFRYADQYYKLHQILAPAPNSPGWVYQFLFWAQAEVIRKLVDYKQDCAHRHASEKQSFPSKIHNWLLGRKN